MAEALHPVVVTGASGFVGRALVGRLSDPTTISLGAPDWKSQLERVRFEGMTVFHLAGRVHASDDDEQAFHDDNAGKTRVLAEAAAHGGARRLVFLSSIKAHTPDDAYGRSKLAAEQALTEVSKAHGLEAVIVRSTLVYGAGAKANLAALLRLADSPWPLPFASLSAPRSFVHVDDLAGLLIACGTQPQARGRTYVAAHREGVAAARLLSLLRAALGRPARLWPMPPPVLELAAALLGQGAKARRLTRPLLADPSAAERELGWSAQVSIEVAVEDLVSDYRARPGA